MASPAVASFLDLPERSRKPRERGLTHVIDRGLSVAEVDGLLEVACLQSRLVLAVHHDVGALANDADVIDDEGFRDPRRLIDALNGA